MKMMKMDTNFKIHNNMDIIKKVTPYFSHCFELNNYQENIVLSVAEHTVLTEEMIFECLRQKNIVNSLEFLRREVGHLSDNEYLTELRVVDLDSASSMLKVYTPGRRGLGWLKAQEKNVCSIKHCMTTYTGEPEKIVKLLVANNLLIHNYQECNYAIGKMFSDKKKSEKNKEKGRLFRAYISFDNERGGKTIIEPVRYERGRMDSFMEKLDRIQKVAVRTGSNLELNKANEVILVAESSEQVEEIITKLNGKLYRGFSIKITIDKDILEGMVSYIQVAGRKKEPFWRTMFVA